MTTEIHGYCDPRFAPMRQAFTANFEQGLELGASLALTWQGASVVDLWAGWADRAQTRPWEENTLVPVASTTKVAMTISMLLLLDRGLIELDAPIARYWPEFAQGGKDQVTIRDALTHQAGVPGFAEPVSFEQLCDWDYITARIAAEPHWYGGERRITYHNQTYGFPLGEVLRRVDGRKPAQFFREEIAGPLDCDFHMALTDPAEMARLAELRPPLPGDLPPAGSLLSKLVTSVSQGDRGSWLARSSDVPAGNGVANGRAIARLTSIMAMQGTLNGRTWLSADLARASATQQAYGQCPYLDWVAFGLGFGLSSDAFAYPSPTTYGWGGFGGSWALMDPATGVSLGYAPSNFSIWGYRVDPRLARIGEALSQVLADLGS